MNENIVDGHVAYFANNNVTRQSKINRIVQHFAERPQVQERLTFQITEKLKETFETDNAACVIDVRNLRLNVRDREINVIKSLCSNVFNQNDNKGDFLNILV
ncbi:MAG: GTP cyclohydrolase I [Flavobacteriales bacterium]|nr:GTP cyclohydrolase I [Flavobacteriales bacterium]